MSTPVRETRHAMKLRHKASLKALLAQPAKGIGAKKAQKDAATLMEAEQTKEVAEFDKREQEEKEQEESGGESQALEEESEESVSASAASAPALTPASSAKLPSRAQQKKAKAAQKDAARMVQLRAETAGMKDERGEEDAAIAALLALPSSAAAPANGSSAWRIKEMVSDGHCLYRALADQVALHNLQLPSSSGPLGFMPLRSLCAAYLRQHRDDFAPFMLTDEGNSLDDAGWEAYLTSLQSENLAVWGGHTELVALGRALQKPIRVWSAAGKMEVGEEFNNDQTVLNISFHKHYFGLGNHYNSVVPQEEEEEFQQATAKLTLEDKDE